MRKSIDQFTADKARLPRSVDELVEAKYLREKPIDPTTGKIEWNEIMGEDANSPDAEQGMVNVKSLSEEKDSDGVTYSEY
jgi:general secretion pathway protein G